MRRWLLWCVESCARAAVARAAIFHLLRGLQNAWATSYSNENEIMNSNQGDHVNFVWTWRRSKQRFSFFNLFYQFIQHHDADGVYRHTPESWCHTSYTGALVWAIRLWISGRGPAMCSRIHACLKNVQPLYNTFKSPALCKTAQVWVSSVTRQEQPSMLINFTNIILINIWFFKSSAM